MRLISLSRQHIPEEDGVNVLGCNTSFAQLLHNATSGADMVAAIQHLVHPWRVAAPVL